MLINVIQMDSTLYIPRNHIHIEFFYVNDFIPEFKLNRFREMCESKCQSKYISVIGLFSYKTIFMLTYALIINNKLNLN